jgi:AcrR family transcriptional regulator
MSAMTEQRRRGGAVRREGAAGVAAVQRARILSSAARVVSEYGYGRMTVARVTGGAGVSRRTFYDEFEDREDCFLAIVEDALGRAAERVSVACEVVSGGWRERVRAGLMGLLAFFDEEPQSASLLVVNALRAGPRVLQRRAHVLERLSGVLQEGGSSARTGSGELPALTGEGVVGAVFGVIHTRLSQQQQQQDTGSMLDLLNPLMGLIVLPYLGLPAAKRELERPVPMLTGGSRSSAHASVPSSSSRDPFEGLDMRLTYRTLRVLGAIAEHPGASNRVIGDAADAHDQGQISKLLARLEKLGLVDNANARGHGCQPTGEPNAWRLTARGEEVERSVRVRLGDDGPQRSDKHKRARR